MTECSRLSNRQLTFAIAVAVCAGANAAQAFSLVTARIAGQLPGSATFDLVFFALWLPLALASIVAGVLGAYRAVSRGTVEGGLLTLFVWLYAIVIKVELLELGWSFFRLAFTFGISPIHIGINFVGIGLIWWRSQVRDGVFHPMAPLVPKAPADASSRAV